MQDAEERVEGREARRRWIACALVAAGITLFFGPLLRGGVLFGKDALIYTLGEKATLREYLLEGRLPTIDPYILSGTPLLENVVAGALYPFNVLLLCGSDIFTGYAVFVWFHYLLAGLGMLAFLRGGLRVATWIAVTGAFGWALGGYLWSMSALGFFAFGAWLPLFALGFVRGVVGERRLLGRWQLLALAALTMLLLCGNFQEAFVSVLLGAGVLCAGLLRAAERRAARAALARFALVVSIAGALAAPQLLPTYEASRASYRSAGVELVEAQDWSFPVQRLPEFVVPFRYGAREGDGLWNTRFYSESRPAPSGPRAGVSPWSDSVFLGLPLLVAALVMITRARRRPALAWGMLFALTFLTALGKATPLYELWYELVPGFAAFRHPEKFLGLASFCLVALGALGWQAALRSDALRAWIVRVALALFVLVAASAAWTLTREVEVFRQGGSSWSLERIRSWVAWQSGLSACALLVLAWAARRRRGLAIVVPALTFAQLFVSAHGTTWTIDADLVRTMRNVVAREELALGDARVVVDLARVPELRPLEVAGGGRIDDVYVLRKLSEVNTLATNAGALFGVPVTGGFSPIARREYVELLGAVSPQVSSELLAARYIVTGVDDAGALPPHLRVLGDSRVLLENTQALPRVALHAEVGTATRRAALERRMQPAAQREALVVVSSARGDRLEPDGLVFPSPARAATIERTRPGELVVRCPDPGWLVVRDAWLAGWRCRTDEGTELPVLRADGIVMAVRNERAGATLTFDYRPPGFRTGLGIAAGALLALASALLLSRRRRAASSVRGSEPGGTGS